MRKLNKLWKLRKKADWNRIAQIGFDVIGAFGIIIIFCAKEFSKNSLSPKAQMVMYLIIGIEALALCRIGSKYYRYMEREAIKEQQKESRRVMKSAS